MTHELNCKTTTEIIKNLCKKETAFDLLLKGGNIEDCPRQKLEIEVLIDEAIEKLVYLTPNEEKFCLDQAEKMKEIAGMRLPFEYTDEFNKYMERQPKINDRRKIPALTKLFLEQKNSVMYYSLGTLISAHINFNIKDNDTIRLPAKDAGIVFDNLGYKLACGRIVIIGDIAGNYAGSNMTGGTLEVRSWPGPFLGFRMQGGRIVTHDSMRFGGAGKKMSGGLILIEGDAAGDVGEGMTGGTIEIEGDVKGEIGKEMDGGTINVHGKIVSISPTYKKGKIIESGKVIRNNQ